MTPLAASSPNALPPVRTSAWIAGTRFAGSSAALSRVPGAPPRTSTAARLREADRLLGDGRRHDDVHAVGLLREVAQRRVGLRAVDRGDGRVHGKHLVAAGAEVLPDLVAPLLALVGRAHERDRLAGEE